MVLHFQSSTARYLDIVVTQSTEKVHLIPIRIKRMEYNSSSKKSRSIKPSDQVYLAWVEVAHCFLYPAHWSSRSGGTNPAPLSATMLSLSPMPF